MKIRYWSSLALATLLLTAFPAYQAQAQADTGYGSTRTNRRPAKQTKEAEPQVLFPNAVRVDPKGTASKSAVRNLQKMFDKYENDDYAAATALAKEVLADPKANAYDRSQAYYVSSYAALQGSNADDNAEAIDLVKKALNENGLSNNTHYQMMLQLVQMLVSDEKYAEALTYADRFLDETKSDNADALILKGNALYRLERYNDAIEPIKKALATSDKPQDGASRLLMAIYFELDRPLDAAKVAEDLVAKNPTDKKLQLDLATIYLQADQPDKALETFERVRKAGLLTEAKDYQTGYRLLSGMDKHEAQTIELINEGLGKGILKPEAEVYTYLGQAYYYTDQIPKAIEAWQKGAPLAANGDVYANLAIVLTQEDRWADAKDAAQKALAKGVKKPGDTWMVIARSEFGLGNKPAMMTAYREAAKYPETRVQAQKYLKQAGGK